MWELAQVVSTDVQRIEQYLKGDYEPFAITPQLGAHMVWFRKRTEDIEANKVRLAYYLSLIEGLVNEIHSKPSKSKSRPSRRIVKESKG